MIGCSTSSCVCGRVELVRGGGGEEGGGGEGGEGGGVSPPSS